MVFNVKTTTTTTTTTTTSACKKLIADRYVVHLKRNCEDGGVAVVALLFFN